LEQTIWGVGGWGRKKFDGWLGGLKIFCKQIFIFTKKINMTIKKANLISISNPLRKFKKISTTNLSAEK
jgi:hypothetical protein